MIINIPTRGFGPEGINLIATRGYGGFTPILIAIYPDPFKATSVVIGGGVDPFGATSKVNSP